MSARILRRGRGRLGLTPFVLVACVAVLAACVYGALILIPGSPSASATPAAPAFLGEVVGSEMPTGLENLRGSAVENATGDVYVTASNSLIEFDPYGAFVREIGGEVDETKVEKRKAQEAAKEAVTVTKLEEDVCTAASGDTCVKAQSGVTAGMLGNPQGVTVEQSTGAVYVIDNSGEGRVDKFAKDGSFVWAIAKEVDKTKVELRKKEEAAKEPVTVSKEEEDICAGASGDVCQAGRGGGKGPGEFEAEVGREMIAVGGPEEHLYVGNKAKVQIFNSAGHQVGEDSLSSLSATGTATAVTVDAAGDVFFADSAVDGVHELEPGGALSGNIYDSSSGGVQAVAVDGSGHLFVVDGSPSQRVLEYEVASPAASPAEFAGSEPRKIENGVSDIAVDGAGTVYLPERSNEGTLVMFGSLAAMESAYASPPPQAPVAASEVSTANPETAEATLQAAVNPEFKATTYQFQYGLEPCSAGHCTSMPVAPAPLGTLAKAPRAVSATVGGLQIGKVYRFRVVATNAAGTTDGMEEPFTVGPGPVAGAPGLPDGRRYELVSPADKNGNEVYPNELYQLFSLASEDGNALLFEGSGAMGAANSSVAGSYVAARTPAGWSTESVIPPSLAGEANIWGPEEVIPSQSFSKFLFMAQHSEYNHEEPFGPEGSVNIFLSEAPGAEPLWLGKPAIGDPFPEPGHMYYNTYLIDGASSDLDTVYFSALGTLVPQDESRRQRLGQAKGEFREEPLSTNVGLYYEPWGFYEWHDGVLSPAGVLPDGSVSEWGAVPPHVVKGSFEFDGTMPDYFNNQVSEDGTKAFFLSPDPSVVVKPGAPCLKEGICTTEVPQLYVRETLSDGSKRTVLVSQSQLPGQEGQPAAHGPDRFEDPVGAPGKEGVENNSYVYASPDGKQAFFFSVDRLTSAAPSNEEAKMYDFDTETGILTYLPGVDGSIAAISPDGSDFIFEDKQQSPAELKLWTAGQNGGSVRPIAQLPKPPTANNEEARMNIDNARASEDGSVFVFGTNAQIPGGFNDGRGYWQMYRYSVSGGELDCVSCPPHGQAPVGNAEASYANGGELGFFGAHSTINTRIMSSNGERVFFDTPNALTAQDTNSKRDVYEWEDGNVYLISSGTSRENSYIMDSSSSGNDVFFSTSAGLVPQDTDGAYDVYDARVPHPGDTPPPIAVPCEGAVCQGPASTLELLGAPASATFSGAGNVTSASTKPTAAHPPKQRKHKSTKGKHVKRKKRRIGKGHGHAERHARSGRMFRVNPGRREHGLDGRGK